MREVKRVVEKHLVFDPQTEFAGDLLKYGQVTWTNELSFSTDKGFEGIPVDKITIHVKPEYGNEVYVNAEDEVLIIKETDKYNFELSKLTRKEFNKIYEYEPTLPA